MGETRGPRRLTRPGESQGARPGPRRRPTTTGAGEGRARIGPTRNSPLTSHRPAGLPLEPRGLSRRPGPASSRLPSGSHGERTPSRASTGPTAAHSGAELPSRRQWSMRSIYGCCTWGRGGRSPRSQSRGAVPLQQPAALPVLDRLGRNPLPFLWVCLPPPLTPSNPRSHLGLSFEVLLGHVATSVPNPPAML